MVVAFDLPAGVEEDTNTSKTAVLILDFQVEFTKPGGKVYSDDEKSGMLKEVPGVLQAARGIGALVIHSPITDGETTNESTEMSMGRNLSTEQTWNSDFAAEAKPVGNDVTLTNSTDQGTDLKSVLEKNAVKRLFLMGFLTNASIAETAKEIEKQMPNILIYYVMVGEDSAPILVSTTVSCTEAQKLLQLAPAPSASLRPAFGGRLNSIMRLSTGSIPEATQENTRPTILALHGAKSNDHVTKLQLENLNITEEDYDIIYLRGSIEDEEGDPELEGLVHGPFFSWVDSKIGTSLIKSVRDVLAIAKTHGPFDGIYGFSSGALVAALAAGISTDMALQNAIVDLEEKEAKNSKRGKFSAGASRRSVRAGSMRASAFSRRASTQQSKRQTSRRLSSRANITRSATGSRRDVNVVNTRTAVNTALTEEEMLDAPFKFVILACAAFTSTDIVTLRKAAGISPPEFQLNSIRTSSFHLIGIEDGFKGKSEEISTLFADNHVMYMPGGHSVGRDERHDEELCNSLRDFTKRLGVPRNRITVPEYVPMSEVSSISLMPHAQVLLVKLDNEKLPKGMLAKSGGATINAVLKARPAETPFLYNARGTDLKAHTTYGDVYSFINGGNGDLRRLGVKPGEVVAYVAPPGGSSAAALAFLAIGAQTCAAPFAPGTTEPDALDALYQFNAKHVILFEGVTCPGVTAAFATFVADGKAKLHKAVIKGNDKPGMFEYLEENEPKFDPTNTDYPQLANPENGKCLLLRTSGTTARPKGVPLLQEELVTNGAIIAHSMGLQEWDVVYSVMPLFHIGGIAASIMCTMASGGAVSCDSEPFDPGRMVDALAISKPQATWYSSVPTIHNATASFMRDVAASDPKYQAYGINKDGIWKEGHSLRMIRSGAAALLGPDGEALAAAYGGVPIYPTYSMSEQMPISQPPAGKTDTFTAKPGSVGVPVAASTAIVSRSRLRPLPRGTEGEIAISGETVIKNYLDNPDADIKAYFYLTLGTEDQSVGTTTRYFLTGDIGVIDEEGFLSLKGRAKELIKKGGEQVSPFEVEEPLTSHPWVQTAVCFSVPSKLYGEEVGCALVLSVNAPANAEQREIIKAMRQWLKEAKLAPLKWPTKWVVCADSDLPKTKTKKYIRVGLSTALGLDPKEEEEKTTTEPKKVARALVDWEVLGGLRFILACYVMFMHIGSKKSWGAVSNLRLFPWHVHVFFMLGGYSMASPMNPMIKKKFSYFLARMGSMYPMYAAALFFAFINLLVVCRPSTFSEDFHWDSQPDDLYVNGDEDAGEISPLFCEGTPATKTSYWGSLVLTLFTYIFGLAVTPTWPMSWFLGYYLWFSSMYYECLAVFPALYNYLYSSARKQTAFLFKMVVGLMLLNICVLLGGWFILKQYEAPESESNPHDDYTDGSGHNAAVLSFYLFGPFWVIYFMIGACAAFLYDAYRPAERHNAWIWGYIADACTIIMIAMSVSYIAVGYGTKETWFNPDQVDHTASTLTRRIWANVSARQFCPVTTLWVFALSTGSGYTASFLRGEFLSLTLAPHSYNCFLFHQMVGQWYFAATRHGIWWNWWRYRKANYWFSPEAVPVEWYEYFLLVSLVVSFSAVMTNLEPQFSALLEKFTQLFTGPEEEEDEDTGVVLCNIIEGMTGIEPEMDWSLDECGLASIGLPMLVGLLNNKFSKGNKTLTVTASDLVDADTIADIVEVVDAAKELQSAQGV